MNTPKGDLLREHQPPSDPYRRQTLKAELEIPELAGGINIEPTLRKGLRVLTATPRAVYALSTRLANANVARRTIAQSMGHRTTATVQSSC